VDHTLFVPEEVSVVFSPGQITVLGLTVIVGVGGAAMSDIVIGELVAEQPFGFV
jgi:hypothetical protein